MEGRKNVHLGKEKRGVLCPFFTVLIGSVWSCVNREISPFFTQGGGGYEGRNKARRAVEGKGKVGAL